MFRRTPKDPQKAAEEAQKKRIAEREAARAKQAKQAADKKAKLQAYLKSHWNKTRPIRESKLLNNSTLVVVNSVAQAIIAERAGVQGVMVHVNSQEDSENMMETRLVQQIMHAVIVPVLVPVTCGQLVEARIMEHLGVDCLLQNSLYNNGPSPFFKSKELGVPTMYSVGNKNQAENAISRDATTVCTIAGVNNSVLDLVEVVTKFRTLGRDVAAEGDEAPPFPELKITDSKFIYMSDKKIKFNVFAYGCIVTPMDAALMMRHGCIGVIVDNNVFEFNNPRKNLANIVNAVQNYKNVDKLTQLSFGAYV